MPVYVSIRLCMYKIVFSEVRQTKFTKLEYSRSVWTNGRNSYVGRCSRNVMYPMIVKHLIFGKLAEVVNKSTAKPATSPSLEKVWLNCIEIYKN